MKYELSKFPKALPEYGCRVCISRKVKCDEVVPICGQYLKGGRTCGGQGSVLFRNMDPTTFQTSDFISKNETSQHSTINSVTLPFESSFVPIQDAQNDHPVPPFIDFFTRYSAQSALFNSWMGALPSLLTSPKESSTKLSFIAVSLIYYGQRTNNKILIAEAYDVYGKALTSQHEELDDIRNETRKPTIDDLYTPLLMSFWEISCITSSETYSRHLFAVGELFQKYEPENCQKDDFFKHFYASRLQLNYASIARGVRSPFCTPSWLSIPFAYHRKTIIDHLVDIITICTGLKARVLSLDPLSDQEEKGDITMLTLNLKKCLDEVWPKYIRGAASRQGWVVDDFDGHRGCDDPSQMSPTNNSSPSNSHQEILKALSPPFDNDPTCPLAFYSTARLLVLYILASVNNAPLCYDEQMMAHSASILSTVELMTEKEAGDAYLSMMLPLYTVATWGHSTLQKERAKEVLRGWTRKRSEEGIGGLCEIVIQDIAISTQCNRS